MSSWLASVVHPLCLYPWFLNWLQFCIQCFSPLSGILVGFSCASPLPLPTISWLTSLLHSLSFTSQCHPGWLQLCIPFASTHDILIDFNSAFSVFHLSVSFWLTSVVHPSPFSLQSFLHPAPFASTQDILTDFRFLQSVFFTFLSGLRSLQPCILALYPLHTALNGLDFCFRRPSVFFHSLHGSQLCILGSSSLPANLHGRVHPLLPVRPSFPLLAWPAWTSSAFFVCAHAIFMTSVLGQFFSLG